MALPGVYLASPVFRQMAGHEQVSPDKREKIAQLFKPLEKNSELFESKTRFLSSSEIRTIRETPAQSMGSRIDTHDEERLSMKDLPDAMETMAPAFPDIHLIPELKV